MSITCESLNCYGDNSCCDYINGNPYCYVSSQCKSDPLWQSIVIPAVLFLFAVCLIVLVIYKLKHKRLNYMQVTNFARQEIRMEPKLSEGRLQTLTSIY